MSYGMKVSKKGYDVKDTGLENLVLSSSKDLYKIKEESDFSITIPAGDIVNSKTIYHNLGYLPSFTVYLDTHDGNDDPILGKRERLNKYEGIGYIAAATIYQNYLYISVATPLTQSGDDRIWTGHYFIFHNLLPT